MVQNKLLNNWIQGNRVLRLTSTHAIGVPHLGDQLVGIHGASLLKARSKEDGGSETEAAIAKNALLYVQQQVKNPANRPITLRFQRSTGEVTAGEMASEARRGFSVLFMSSKLGLSFNLDTGKWVHAKYMERLIRR